MRILSIFILVGILVALVTTPALAQSDDLSFADALYAEGDYYRAITEYKRFRHQHPSDPQAGYALLRIGESYLAGKRWTEAEATFSQVIEAYPASAEAEQALLLHAAIPYEQKNFSLARDRYGALLDKTLSDSNRQRILWRIPWTFIEQDRYSDARQALANSDDPRSAPLQNELLKLEALPLKSPRLAGSLSAILPGAGQLYCGRYREAGMAFLLNAAFILGTAESFADDNITVGSILLFFEVGWYAGNIYNAVNNAHKYNRELREQEKERLRAGFAWTKQNKNHSPLLVLSFNF